MCLCQYELQPCHFYCELPMVGFMLVKLALYEVGIFKGHVCALLSVIGHVLTLASSVAIVGCQARTFQFSIRFPASTTCQLHIVIPDYFWISQSRCALKERNLQTDSKYLSDNKNRLTKVIVRQFVLHGHGVSLSRPSRCLPLKKSNLLIVQRTSM